jgi:tetratricopeptide (TPR) repeat protein
LFALAAALLQLSTMPTVEVACHGLELNLQGVREPRIEGEAVCRVEYIVHIDGLAEVETVDCEGEVDGFDYGPRARFDLEVKNQYGRRYQACRQQACEPLPNFPHSRETADRARECRQSLDSDYTHGFSWIGAQAVRDETGLDTSDPGLIRQALEARRLRSARDKQNAIEALSSELHGENLYLHDQVVILDTLAYLSFSLGQYQQALDFRRQADALSDPAAGTVDSDGVLAGLALEAMHPEQDSVTIWHGILEARDRPSPRVALHLSRAQADSGRWDGARESILMAMRGAVLPTIRLADAHPEEASDWADWIRAGRSRLRSVRDEPEHVATLNLILGLAAHSAGRSRDARDYFDEARAAGTFALEDDRLAAFWIAEAQSSRGNESDAEATLGEVLAGAQNLEDWEHSIVAELYARTGNFTLGLAHAVEAYRASPEDPRRASLVLLYRRELGHGLVSAALNE